MSQSFHYTSLAAGGFDVDLGTQAARLGDYGGYSMRAEVADVGTSTFIIDDPLGTVGNASDDILGLHGFYVTESDCAAVGANGVNGQRLFTGYTRERTYRRGTGPRTSLRTGVAREIEVALTDLNFYASWRINRDSSSVLTGTVTKTSGNTTVSGSGTAFLTQLDVGSTISVPGGGGTDILYVASVGSNTSLTVVTAPANSASGQVLTRLDGARPAETDVQRVEWLISGQANSLPPFFYVTNDAGWIDTSGPVNMDANDYTGQTAADVLNDCAIASGKNYWIGHWEATGNNSLWYANSNTSTTYSSLLNISDVLADVDQVTTFAPEPDAALRRDPVRVYAGVYLPFESGTSYQTNATTGSNYGWRDASAPTSNIKTQAKADAAALRMVNDATTEEDRISCTVRLPSSLATGIKVGQRIQCRFQHLPGYASLTWTRVVDLRITQDEATDKRYTLAMELTPQTIIGNGKTLAVDWVYNGVNHRPRVTENHFGDILKQIFVYVTAVNDPAASQMGGYNHTVSADQTTCDGAGVDYFADYTVINAGKVYQDGYTYWIWGTLNGTAGVSGCTDGTCIIADPGGGVVGWPPNFSVTGVSVTPSSGTVGDTLCLGSFVAHIA